MAVFSYAGPLGEVQAAHSTAGGQPLAAGTPIFVCLPDGTKHIFVQPHTFTSARVASIQLNPYLGILKTTDNLSTGTDYSAAAQDRQAATSVVLSSMATTDFLYVGAHLPFRGVMVTIANQNTTPSVLTVNYWNGSAWANTSATDNTISGGTTTLNINGSVVWTVPTAWQKKSLIDIANPVPVSGIPMASVPLYWTRWQVSVGLSANVKASAMLAMGRAGLASEWVANSTLETTITKALGGIATVEVDCNAGSGFVNINAAVNTGANGFV